MKNATDTISSAATQSLQMATKAARAAPPRRMRKVGVGFSIRYKIFLLVLLLVALILGTTVGLVQYRATAVARRAIDAGMRTAETSFRALLDGQVSRAKTAIRQLADDPNTIAAITQYEHKTVLDYIQSKRDVALRSVDYIMALDEHGLLLARTDNAAAAGVDLAEKSPLFSMPLLGSEAHGFGEKKGGSLVLLASAPVREGGVNIRGALVFAYPVDAAFATDAKAVTNADATFFLESNGELKLSATTLTGSEAESLRQGLASRPELTGASMGEGKTVGPVDVPLGDDHTVLIAVPLTSASDDRIGLFVASRSLYREMATFRQIRNILLSVGGGALLVALFVTYLLASRITRPLTALAAATEQVAEGDLEVEIPPAPQDEVGALTKAFSRMVIELRQKAEMEEYLRNLKMQSPGIASSLTATQSPAATSPAGLSKTLVSVKPLDSTLDPGALFHGRYEVLQLLGAGAMGTVYRARDRDLDEEIAIKTIRSEALKNDPTAIDRFKQEIKLARRITHKHVLRTFDYGEIDGVFFITMEYMKGVTLKYLLEQRKQMPIGPGLRLARQICLGLSAAHEQGIVHRDIKPQNMLVNQRGDLKIMDFGIARVANSSGMTQTGIVIGTPHYMSPEQAQGKSLDPRSDIYSTGVVMYEMFTGRVPFDGDTALAVVLKHVREQPVRPRELSPAISSELDRIIMTAMAKEPEARHQSIIDLYDDLSTIAA